MFWIRMYHNGSELLHNVGNMCRCNGACSVSLNLLCPCLRLWRCLCVCVNLTFDFRFVCPWSVHRGGYVTARL